MTRRSRGIPYVGWGALVALFLAGAPSETLAVVVNLSSRPFAGNVKGVEGAWRDITPGASSDSAASANTPAKIALGAWEFRVFRRK